MTHHSLLNSKISISQDATSRIIDGQAVILSFVENSYFGLDEIGTEIWDWIASGLSTSQILDNIVSNYEVTPEQAEQDLHALLEDLQKHKLIEVSVH